MYTKIESRFWQDEKMRSVSNDARFLFLYLLSSPHRNIIGLYFLPSPYACFDLGWDESRFKNALEELINIGCINYDYSTNVVFIKNYLKYNPLENPNQVKSAIEKLNEVPKTKLFHDFYDTILQISQEGKDFFRPLLDYLEEVLKRVSEPFRNGFETVTETVSKGFRNGSERVSEPFRKGLCNGFETVTETSNRNRNSNSNSNSNSNKNISSNEQSAGMPLKAIDGTGENAMGEIPQEEPAVTTTKKREYSKDFEEFWEVYPRKVEKLRAYKCWQARLREGVSKDLLITAAKNYAQKCLAEGTEQRYIKHPATFLGPSKPYEDYIHPLTVIESNVPKAWHKLRRYLELEEDNEDDEEGSGEASCLHSGCVS